jgi:hypothetical protein
MQNSRLGILGDSALALIQEAARLRGELRITLETHRILMDERKQILREQSQIALKSGREVRAMNEALNNCLRGGRAVEWMSNEDPTT